MRCRPLSRLVATITLLGAGCAALLAVPAPVFAHAQLEQVDPPDRAVLSVAPRQITVTFNEPVTVTGGGLFLYDRSGTVLRTGPAVRADRGTSLSVTAPAGLPDDAYLVAWRVVSADGHPTRGATVFFVGPADNIDAAVIASVLARSAVPPSSPLGTAGKIASYLGVLAALGAAVALHLGWAASSPRNRRGVLTAVVLGAAGATATWMVQARLLVSPGSSPFGASAIADMMSIPAGRVPLLRGSAALLVGAVVAWWPSRRVRVLVLETAAVLITLSAAWSGHAATVTPLWLAAVTASTHVFAVALWSGGVWMLAFGGRDDGFVAAVRSFSNAATVAVFVVPAAGALLAWRVLAAAGADGLTTSPWGRTLLLKTGLFTLLAAVGAVSHVLVRGRRVLMRVRWLRALLVIEAAAMLAVFGATGLLTAKSPVPAVSAVDNFVAPLTGFGDVDVSITPAVAGTTTVHLYVLENGRPAAVDGVQLRFTNTDHDIGPIVREPLPAGPGHFIYTGTDLIVAGAWQVEVRVTVDAFTELAATGTVVLAPSGTAQPDKETAPR